MESKKCPYCGADLPQEASFCPHCARSLNPRKPIKPPQFGAKKIAVICILAVLALAVGSILYQKSRPKTYEGIGEVDYVDPEGNTLQLLLRLGEDRTIPMPEITQLAGFEERYRFPLRFFANYKETGEDATELFLEQMESAEIQTYSEESSESMVQCTEPETSDVSTLTGTTLASFVDYNRDSPSKTEIRWNFRMKNGDSIVIKSNLLIEPTERYEYGPDTEDLSTAQALQAVIDQAQQTAGPMDDIMIHLPPVIYTEPIVIQDFGIYLYGSESNGQRTTFAGGLQVLKSNDRDNLITYINDIDIIGNGSGIGISNSNRLWLTNCRLEGWQTGVFSYGNGWTTVTQCTFEENEEGLYITVDGQPHPMHSIMEGNKFKNNGIGFHLECLSDASSLTLTFEGSAFQGNGTDIVNNSSIVLDTSDSFFE